MKKRGISAVVATVLMILIVVVGIGIVWKVILPLFTELEFLSYSDVQLKIVRQGFTVYDPEQNFAFVQIERGKDEVNVTGVEIGFSFGGTTKTYQSKSVPTPNGKYTYKFNFTNDSDMGIPQNVTPDKVTVAPIFTINNKVRLGKILDSEDMPVGRIRLSAEEWKKANDEAAIPVVVKPPAGCSDCPGEPEPDPEPITCPAGEVEYNGGCAIDVNAMAYGTRILDQAGKTYVLTDNISVTGLGINITGANALFDLMGYSINSTSPGGGIGIWVEDVDFIHIINGNINGFMRGILMFDSSNNVVENVNVFNGGANAIAIALDGGSNNNLSNIIIDNQGIAGISFDNSNENLLKNIIISNSGGRIQQGAGINVFGLDNEFVNVVAIENNNGLGIGGEGNIVRDSSFCSSVQKDIECSAGISFINVTCDKVSDGCNAECQPCGLGPELVVDSVISEDYAPNPPWLISPLDNWGGNTVAAEGYDIIATLNQSIPSLKENTVYRVKVNQTADVGVDFSVVLFGGQGLHVYGSGLPSFESIQDITTLSGGSDKSIQIIANVPSREWIQFHSVSVREVF